MAQVNYSSDQINQIADLQAYLEANNIDPTVYMAAIDGNAIDTDLKNDPAFQAYWQLTYLQLTEILNPTMINSPEGDVGEIDFQALYDSASPEYNQFIEDLIADDPSIMTVLGNEANQQTDTLLGAIQTATGGSETAGVTGDYDVDGAIGGSENYMGYSADARSIGEQYDLGEGYDWIIQTEEGIRAAEGSIMTTLAEMDQMLVDLKEGLQSGTISAEQFAADAENISVYRETYLGMMQQLETSLMTVMEMISKIIEQATETNMAIVNNSRAV